MFFLRDEAITKVNIYTNTPNRAKTDSFQLKCDVFMCVHLFFIVVVVVVILVVVVRSMRRCTMAYLSLDAFRQRFLVSVGSNGGGQWVLVVVRLVSIDNRSIHTPIAQYAPKIPVFFSWTFFQNASFNYYYDIRFLCSASVQIVQFTAVIVRDHRLSLPTFELKNVKLKRKNFLFLPVLPLSNPFIYICIYLCVCWGQSVFLFVILRPFRQICSKKKIQHFRWGTCFEQNKTKNRKTTKKKHRIWKTIYILRI